MTVRDAIAARRSIRKFTGQPVPRQQLLELVETARLSPSSCNSQPWRFKLVGAPEDIEWLSGPASSKQGWIAKAGAVLVCCVDAKAYMSDSRATVKALRDAGLLTEEFAQDVELRYLKPVESGSPALLKCAAALNLARAMSAMMLHAVEMGLGTTWVGRVEEKLVKEHFGLPEHIGVVGLLPVGYPDESPEPRPRRSLEEILL